MKHKNKNIKLALNYTIKNQSKNMRLCNCFNGLTCIGAYLTSLFIVVVMAVIYLPCDLYAQSSTITYDITEAGVLKSEPGEGVPADLKQTTPIAITDNHGRHALHTLRNEASGTHRFFNFRQIGITGICSEQQRDLQHHVVELESMNRTSIITAEEMNRFGDYTVRDALVRIPGVQVGARGEINIRGVGRDRLNVKVDGQRMATTGLTDRSVDLGMLPSDLVRNLEVIKVVSPDMHADAMSGVINLNTVRPVGDERKIDIYIGGGGNTEYLGFTGPDARFSFNYAESVTDELVLNLSFSRQRLHSSYNSLEIDYDVEDFGDGFEDVIGRIAPGQIHQSRNTYGGGIRLSYQPSTDNTYYVRGLIIYDDRLLNHQNYAWVANQSWSDPRTVQSGLYKYDINLQDIISHQYTIKGGGRHFFDYFRLEYSLGLARSNVNDDGKIFPFQVGGQSFNIDMENRRRPFVQLMEDRSLPESSNLILQPLNHITANRLDNTFSGRVDVQVPFGRGYFKLGSSMELKQKDVNDIGAFTDYEMRFFGFLSLEEFEKDRKGSDLFNHYQMPWLVSANDINRFFRTNASTMARNQQRFHEVSDYKNYKIFENIYAGYGMTTYEIGRLTLMGGARIEYTDSEIRGRITSYDRFGRYDETVDTARTTSRVDLFPNFQIAFSPGVNTKLHMAYSKTIGRPDFLMISPFETVNRRDTVLFRGNPNLNPMLSNNLDFFLDHRVLDAGIISINLFYKQLSNFIFLREQRIDVTEGDFSGIDPMFSDETEFISVKDFSYRNSDHESASLYGVELSWQQRLIFLPGFLSNFGIFANYTWSNSVYELEDRDTDVALPYQSPHAVNASVDYIRGRLSTMVSYHWSAESISLFPETRSLAPSVNRTEEVFMDHYNDGWSDLSVSIRIRLTGNFSYWADIHNLMRTERIHYQYNRDLYPNVIDYTDGVSFRMGISYNL